jgi:hypothetical protein
MGFLFQAPRNQDPTFPFSTPGWAGSCQTFARPWLIRLEQLDPIAERVLGIEPAKARDLTILDDWQAAGDQPRAHLLEVVGKQGRVPPAACHRGLDAAVQLLIAAGKPDAPTVSQASRFFDFFEPKQLGIEASRGSFSPECDCDLNMVNPRNPHRASLIHTLLRIGRLWPQTRQRDHLNATGSFCPSTWKAWRASSICCR